MRGCVCCGARTRIRPERKVGLLHDQIPLFLFAILRPQFSTNKTPISLQIYYPLYIHRLLAPALMPVVARLTDGSLSVKASAEACVSAFVTRCGYSDLSDLIRRNGDWIVDDICRQLRELDQHPRAPQLLSSLLAQAKVAADLLPLMAEPLRLSLSGISLLARAKQPQHTQAFARSLRELSRGLRDEGDRLLTSARTRYFARQEVLDLLGPSVATTDARTDDDYEPKSLSQPSMREIGSFFAKQRAETKKKRQEASLDDDPDAYQARDGDSTVTRDFPPGLEASIWSDLDADERRYVAAGSIATSVVENVAPLVTSGDLPTALLAVETVVEALRGLQSAADTVKLNEHYRQRIGLKTRTLRAAPSDVSTYCHVWALQLSCIASFF